MRYLTILFLSLMLFSCKGQADNIQTGAEQLSLFMPMLEGKKLAILANHTSLVGNAHLIDTLLSYSGIEIKKVFAPEHGFRGREDAGATVENQVDLKTGLPIISLYGKNRKPTKEHLKDIDIVVFDIQDVGVRFFTYISTMHYMMEACAENNVQLLVLDRPNPNGSYTDGPVMEEEFMSFVGMHPIPVVHGMTVAELARMINGEGWLKDSLSCELQVVPCRNYTHQMSYILSEKPSPNLPDMQSIYLYPSTCFFEGTVISEGRGTLYPFEVYGHPDLEGHFSFTPVSIEGMSTNPKFKDQICYGEDLRNYLPESGWKQIELSWLINAYEHFPDKEKFFLPYFETLAGTSSLRRQIEDRWTEEAIRDSWKSGLADFIKRREKYMLYQ